MLPAVSIVVTTSWTKIGHSCNYVGNMVFIAS